MRNKEINKIIKDHNCEQLAENMTPLGKAQLATVLKNAIVNIKCKVKNHNV